MRKITNLFLFLTPILAGCSDENTQALTNRIDARTFTLETPPGWTLTEDQGYDTYIGRVSDRDHTIFFDQGFLSFNGLNTITEYEGTLSFERVTINGVSAIIHKRKIMSTSTAGIILSAYLEDENTGKRNHLYIWDPSSSSETLLIQIFKTHQFK